MSADRRTPDDRRSVRGLVAAVLAGAVVAAVLAGLVVWVGAPGGRSTDGGATGAGAADVRMGQQRYGAAPTYALTDQRGTEVSSRQFAGRVQVVGFLFPYCTTDCPVLAHDLATLQHKLAAQGLGDKVSIVTFNIDPTGAGPRELEEFLSQYGAATDPATAKVPWYYLTGSARQVQRVVRDGYHVAYWKDKGEEEGTQHPNALAEKAQPGYDIKHQDAIYIVDGDGQIRQYYGTMAAVNAESLLRAVHRVLG